MLKSTQTLTIAVPYQKTVLFLRLIWFVTVLEAQLLLSYWREITNDVFCRLIWRTQRYICPCGRIFLTVSTKYATSLGHICKDWDYLKFKQSAEVILYLLMPFSIPPGCLWWLINMLSCMSFNPVESDWILQPASPAACVCVYAYACVCACSSVSLSWDPACVNCFIVLSVLGRVMSCNAPLELTIRFFPFSLPCSISQREVCPRRLLERSERIVSPRLTLVEDEFADRIEPTSAVGDKDRV